MLLKQLYYYNSELSLLQFAGIKNEVIITNSVEIQFGKRLL